MLPLLLLSMSSISVKAIPVEAPYDALRFVSSNTLQSLDNSLLPVHSVVRDPTIKFENLAIRSNGQILTTSTLPNASIYQVDPLGILPLTLVYNIPNITSSCGIVEREPDIFYVVSGDISLKNPFDTTPASYSITKLNVTGLSVLPNGTLNRQPIAHRVANLTGAALPNGAAFAGQQSDNLLVADTIRGLIWNVNVRTGTVSVTLNDTSTKGITAKGQTASGVNGIKVHNGTIYYTSTGASALYKVPVDTQGIISTGIKPSLVTSNLTCDDLIVTDDGIVYVAGTENVITKVSPTGEKKIIAGIYNSTASPLGGSSAIRFGRLASDRWSMYVTTNGGLNYPVPESEGVSRIDLG